MATKTYSRGVLFWIDDSLDPSNLPYNLWNRIFGDRTDKVFRLMDLSLEIATSYEEAVARINSFNSYREAGTFLYCVVDLMIPLRKGDDALLKYGVALAQLLRDNGISFSFLSANADATHYLDMARLNNVPYYVKVSPEFTFPEPLSLKILSEIRRHITWVSVSEAIGAMNRESDLFTKYRALQDSFKYFPFFGPHRDFVERCDHRKPSEIIKTIALRSPHKHSHEFVQQSLAIFLSPLCIQKPGQHTVLYGDAHSKEYLVRLERDFQDDPDSISVLRITPEKTNAEDLDRLIMDATTRVGRTIFILPSDESVDPYFERLRNAHIPTLDELPEGKLGDVNQREELIRQSCVLAFQQWLRGEFSGEPILLERGSLAYPELLINPISWVVMLEPSEFPEHLSDAIEIVRELSETLCRLGKDTKQYKALKSALEHGLPIPYEHQIKLGYELLLTPEYKEHLIRWIERTIDTWLKTSWQFPYGIIEGFDWQDSQIGEITNYFTEHREKYQDSCYNSLVGILKDYRAAGGRIGKRRKDKWELKRVVHFINALGGNNFLTKDIESVDWEELELIRWPHRQYPMPSAVLRRLREAGKYLWIQPEGLDLAITLPAGRQRYRLLSSIVDQYGTTLAWCDSIIDDLPRGWRHSVSYLIDIISDHRIAEAWTKEPENVWLAILGLLRNAGPVLYITDQLIKGERITGTKDAIKEELEKITGHGTILGKLRGSRGRRLMNYLVRSDGGYAHNNEIENLQIAKRYLSTIHELMGTKAASKVQQIEILALELINAFDNSNSKEGNEIAQGIRDFFRNNRLGLTESAEWFQENLGQKLPDHFEHGITPSLLGSKIDYLWKLMDVSLCLENATYPYRYFDGYHFLASVWDLRIHKGTYPPVPLPVIETIIDLFLASIEGILAQLAWCVQISGHERLATSITPRNVQVIAPDTFTPPATDDLSRVFLVNKLRNDWEVYTLGIPGIGAVKYLSYHDVNSIKRYSAK